MSAKKANKSSTMTFGTATKLMQRGKKVARQGWNGKNMFLMYAAGGTWKDKKDFVQGDLEPFIVMFTAAKKFIPWLASQADVLADDWVEVV